MKCKPCAKGTPVAITTDGVRLAPAFAGMSTACTALSVVVGTGGRRRHHTKIIVEEKVSLHVHVDVVTVAKGGTGGAGRSRP
jgi:hypothetical protein